MIAHAPPTHESRSTIELFLHIPKTGGSTLNRLIYTQYASSDEETVDASPMAGLLERGLTYNPPGLYHVEDCFYTDEAYARLNSLDIRDFEVAPPRAVLGHFPFGLHRLFDAPFRYFTLLRDPISRVVSLYHHHRRYGDDTYGVISRNLSLERFISEAACLEADNDQTRRLSGTEAEFGQCSEDMLERAKENLSRHFFLVGVTERFDESLVLLRRALGWSDVHYLPRLVNPSGRAELELSDATHSLIAAHNQLDVELYRFARSRFEERLRALDADFFDEVTTFKKDNARFISENGWAPMRLQSARIEDLLGLPGIGAVLAGRLVTYREKRGDIAMLDELKNVPGIGPTRLRRLQDLLVP